MPAANSCSPPGIAARPRSPLSQSPGGALKVISFNPLACNGSDRRCGWYMYVNENSTALKPARAACAKRWRKGTSPNKYERFALNRGIVPRPVEDQRQQRLCDHVHPGSTLDPAYSATRGCCAVTGCCATCGKRYLLITH